MHGQILMSHAKSNLIRFKDLNCSEIRFAYMTFLCSFSAKRYAGLNEKVASPQVAEGNACLHGVEVTNA